MNNANPKRNITKRKLYRTLFGIFSLSGILFVFQSCYGTPQDFGQDVLVQGKVTSAGDHSAIPGIKVQLNETGQYTISATDGTYSLYCERMPVYNFTFIDTDGSLNGQHQVCDTTVHVDEQSDVLTLSVELR